MSAHTDPLAATVDDWPTWTVIALAVGIILGTLLAVVSVVVASAVTAPVSPLSGRLHQAAVGVPVVLGLYEGVRRLVGVPAGWLLAARPTRAVWRWAAVGLLFPAAVLGLQLWLFRAAVTVGDPPIAVVAGAVLASLAGGLLAGVLEELALRGALLRVLETRWGPRSAVGLTAAVFAALHQGHAGRVLELVFVLSAMFAAGLLLGAVAVRTRSVWNAVALHAGWNTVFGGLLVTAVPTPAGLPPGIIRFRLPDAPGVLAGAGATLGAAPVTTACLLGAALVVGWVPGRWLRRLRPVVAGRTAGDP